MQWPNNGVALNLNYDGVANDAKVINVRVANKKIIKIIKKTLFHLRLRRRVYRRISLERLGQKE